MIFNPSGNRKGNVDDLIAALYPKLSPQNDRPALLQSIPMKDLQSIGAANQEFLIFLGSCSGLAVLL